jgi:hypothetical protein
MHFREKHKVRNTTRNKHSGADAVMASPTREQNAPACVRAYVHVYVHVHAYVRCSTYGCDGDVVEADDEHGVDRAVPHARLGLQLHSESRRVEPDEQGRAKQDKPSRQAGRQAGRQTDRQTDRVRQKNHKVEPDCLCTHMRTFGRAHFLRLETLRTRI